MLRLAGWMPTTTDGTVCPGGRGSRQAFAETRNQIIAASSHVFVASGNVKAYRFRHCVKYSGLRIQTMVAITERVTATRNGARHVAQIYPSLSWCSGPATWRGCTATTRR